MSNIIKFPDYDRLETKEDYTWMQLLFTDTQDEKAVRVNLYSFGGDGVWQFITAATIEDFESDTASLFTYDNANEKFFIESQWRINEGEWCELCDKYMADAIKGFNPNGYEVKCEPAFGDG